LGGFDSFSRDNLDLAIYVNGTLGNNSKNYTALSREIRFREVDTDIDRLAFNYTFDSPLNVRGISIETQGSGGHYGFMVIRGLNLTKTVWVDKLNSSSNRVCVKNSDGTIDDVSDNCEGTREYLIDCPGSNAGIKCSLDGGYFVVSGITRSIVKEWLNDITAPIQNCTLNWSCTLWSDCVGGSKTRICTDKAYCNDTTGKPATSENCTVSVCNTNWTCTPWAPTDCPVNLTQTRACSDSNSCNILTGKPNQTRTCERPAQQNWQLIGIIVAVVILLIIAVLIVISKLNGGRRDDSYVDIQGIGPRGPPGGPAAGYAPVIVRPIQRTPMTPMQPRPMQPQPRPMPSGAPFGSY